MRKRLAIILVAVLVVGGIIFALWWIGAQKEKSERAAEIKYYENLIAKQAALENLVAERLAHKGIAAEKTVPAVRYTIKDIAITTEASAADLKRYAANIAAALKPYGDPRPNEARVALEALAKNDRALLQPIQNTITIHTAA